MELLVGAWKLFSHRFIASEKRLPTNGAYIYMDVSNLWHGIIIKPISFELKKHHVKRTQRGLLYTLGIFSAEFISGCMLKKAFKCPWDYSKCKYNIKGVIRLDYAPIWFIVGLFYENVLNKESKNKR